MKTLAKLTVLSLVLIFAASAANANRSEGIEKAPAAHPIIRHVVNVMMTSDLSYCGNYVIEIRTSSGKLIAPPRVLFPGQSTYVFYERADLNHSASPRTAFLRETGNGGAWCENGLKATPCTVRGPFQPMKSYFFQLNPVSKGKEE
jgi:hypothetical protein